MRGKKEKMKTRNMKKQKGRKKKKVMNNKK